MGVILYTLLFGHPPFESPDIKQTYKKIKHCQYTIPLSPPTSTEAKSLITSLLSPLPSSRPTLLQIKSHPFFSPPCPSSMPSSIFTCAPTQALGGISQDLTRGESRACSNMSSRNFCTFLVIQWNRLQHLRTYQGIISQRTILTKETALQWIISSVTKIEEVEIIFPKAIGKLDKLWCKKMDNLLLLKNGSIIHQNMALDIYFPIEVQESISMILVKWFWMPTYSTLLK